MMNPVATLESLYPYFENLAEGIAILDPDGRVVSMNGIAARLLGFNGREKAQVPLQEFSDAFLPSGERIPTEERPSHLALHGHFVRGFEAALLPKGEAEANYVEISTAPLPDPDGQTAHVVISYRKINERKKTDLTRARLASIVESSEDAIVGKDLNGIVTAWNHGAEKLFGYAAEEMIGQSIRKLLLPGQEAEEDEIMHRIGRGETIQHSERRRRRKNGELVEVSVTISPIRNNRGEVVGVSKIARDITSSRRAADALHESQQRLTGIIDSAMDAIITVDGEQRVVLFNAAAERMFLCSQSSALGSPLQRFIPEHVRGEHPQDLLGFAVSGVANRSLGELGSLWAIRSNGQEFEIEASISQVESQGHRLFTVILRDVTERKQTEESLRQQSEMLRVSQIFARDTESRIVFWPEGAQKMYGFSEEEALGAVSHELFQTQFPEPIVKIDEHLYRTGRWEGDLVHQRRDGETIVVSSAWILHRDAQGNPVRIMESVVDVTARRRADEKIRAQSAQLALQSEALAYSQHSLEEKALMLQSVLDSMCDGLVTADEQGRFVLWNAAADRILGMGPAEKGPDEWTDHYGLFREDNLTIAGHLNKPFRLAEVEDLFRGHIPQSKPVVASPCAEVKITDEDLRRAIRDREFILYYQPQIEIATGEVEGLEALARWQHPQLGLLPPDCFIPRLEALGEIDSFCWLMADRGLEEARRFPANGRPAPHIAINVSAQSLKDLRFPDTFVSLAGKHCIPAESIIVEITESSFMDDHASALDVLTRLRMKNVQLSIDDFGTGYAMMQQLVNIPANELKIDKAFVLNMHANSSDRVMVEKTIEIGHELGMTVTAEGVETEAQLTFLRQKGCDRAQGYLFSRPLPLASINEWIRNRHAQAR